VVLSVNSAGEATLTIQTSPVDTIVNFQVSDQQLRQFTTVLEKEDFFALDGEHGEKVPDSSVETICVTVGKTSKSVTRRYLADLLDRGDRNALRDASRAMNVHEIVRGWFDDARAADVRR
jgi:hypothetical protein